MGKELRDTIKDITHRHLKKFKSQVFGQNLTGVGWVAGTLPKLFEKDGVIELPMADVAGGGIVTGSALMGKGRYILFVIKVIIGLIVYLLLIMHVSPTRFGECLAQL